MHCVTIARANIMCVTSARVHIMCVTIARANILCVTSARAYIMRVIIIYLDNGQSKGYAAVDVGNVSSSKTLLHELRNVYVEREREREKGKR